MPPATDARVDAYIEKSPEFARPVLAHLRAVVHVACPDAEETMKWSVPHFEYRGMLCRMAAVKEHCAFGFWGGTEMLGPTVFEGAGRSGARMNRRAVPGPARARDR